MSAKGLGGSNNGNVNTMSSAFQAAQQPQKAAGGDSFSFRKMGNVFRSAMGRTPASEVLSKMTKAVDGVLAENVDNNFSYTLIPIDMNVNPAVSVSVLIVAMQDKAQDAIPGVAFHTLILEASSESPAPRSEQINGQNVEVLRVTGDADDPVLNQVVLEAVSKQFPQERLLNAGACVVPRDFNIQDSNLLFQLVGNAAFADTSEIATSSKDFADLNLAHAENDCSLVVRTTFESAQIHDAVGQPIRSDVVIDFSAAPQQNNAMNQQGVERVSQISTVHGFLDLVWDPMQPIANVYSMPQQQSFQRYAARFVMTALESNSLLTIPAQLLALIPSLTLRENNTWVQAFRPKPFNEKGVDLRDIGAIGIEVNFEGNASGYGQRVDTKADSFKPEMLGKLISATVRPGLILSLDVPECGPQTWYNGVFAAAAEGNPKANQLIIEAANTLTNNAFSKYFPSNGRVALDENNRIHLGSYRDRNDVRRDIRDIDYLAVMNMVGEKDPLAVRDWSDTILKTNYPLTQRLAARKRIITALFNDVQFTGFARRVTFEAEFIESLARACNDAGLNIRVVSPYADLGSYERATAQFGHAIMPGNTVDIFNRGNFAQHNMGGNRGLSRW